MKKKRCMRGKRFLRTAAAILVLAVFLAGCGNAAVGSADSMAEQTSGSAASGASDQAASDVYDAGGENSVGTGTAEAVTESGDAGNSGGAAASISDGQKLIRTVNMTVETTEFDALIAGLKAKTQELGGYTERSEVNTSSGGQGGRWASLTLRIPAEGLDTFLAQVNEEANVTYSNESTEDVTLSYTDTQSHVEALRAEQESLLSMLENAASMEDILAIQTQLTQVRYEIESCESRLRVYDNQVNYSTVYLDVSEVVRETSASGTSFGERVKIRFQDNLYRIGSGFTDFAVGFLGALPVLILLAAVAAAVILIVKKGRKLKKKLEAKRFKDMEKDGES